MNQLLVALCLIGGIWYLVSANPKGNENADRSLVSEQVSALIPTEQDKAYPDQLAPISPAAELSRHAIVPDQSPAALAARSESPPQPTQPSQPEIGPTPGDRLQVKSETSIRNGPSASAQVIGTAYAGARLQIQSRDAEWVQFVDRATKPAGWISLAFLAPADESVDVSATSSKALTNSTRPAKLLGFAKPRNAQRKLQTTVQHKPVRQPHLYAGLPRDPEFEPPRQGRVFGLFLKRRLSTGLSPYPFR